MCEKPGLNRYLRVTAGGLLRVYRTKIAEEAKLNGKSLLRTSDRRRRCGSRLTRRWPMSSGASGTLSGWTYGPSTTDGPTGSSPTSNPAVLVRPPLIRVAEIEFGDT